MPISQPGHILVFAQLLRKIASKYLIGFPVEDMNPAENVASCHCKLCNKSGISSFLINMFVISLYSSRDQLLLDPVLLLPSIVAIAIDRCLAEHHSGHIGCYSYSLSQYSGAENNPRSAEVVFKFRFTKYSARASTARSSRTNEATSPANVNSTGTEHTTNRQLVNSNSHHLLAIFKLQTRWPKSPLVCQTPSLLLGSSADAHTSSRRRNRLPQGRLRGPGRSLPEPHTRCHGTSSLHLRL
jgi:hypothetical protein